MRTIARMAVLLVCVVAPATALAQRVPFDRAFDVQGPATLDVTTIRGKIEVVGGAPGRIVVAGTATVRVGWDVPANAEEIAKRVAASPPIEQVGGAVRLGEPKERDAQRAVIVSYRVEVPPDTRVQTSSNSGETSIRGVAAAVDVRTQSGAIDLSNLSGAIQISTGSGAVMTDDISGSLSVSTSSSGFAGTRLRASLHARTKSGDINAVFEGAGSADVETGSSAITLRGIRGGLFAKTQSGRVIVQGTPTADWVATTSSSSVNFEFPKSQGFELDAESRSGAVTVEGGTVSTPVTKYSAKGSVGNGGPLVRVRTGSGAIKIQCIER